MLTNSFTVTTEKIIYLAIGLIGGFLIGFIFANSANLGEQESMRAELTRLRAGAAKGERAGSGSNNAGLRGDATDAALSDEELRRAIANGDANPNDIEKQRKIGRGIYLYAMNTGKTTLLPDAVRLLRRAHKADPKDYETKVLLAEALFDAGQGGDAALSAEARKYFAEALAMKPDDVNVRTELGLTYYFDRPPNPRRAIQEYRRALALDPRHEMTLQSIAAALIVSGETVEAQRRLDELQSVNSSNAALPNLRTQLAQVRDSAKERK